MTKPEQHVQAAIGYIALGLYQDAWDELEELPPEHRAEDAVFELRIEIFQKRGKWDSARVLAESLARRSPENPGGWLSWSYALRREKSV